MDIGHTSCLMCSQNCRRIHRKGYSVGAAFPAFALLVKGTCLDEDLLRLPSAFADDFREILDEAWEMQEGYLYLEGPSRIRWPVATCRVSSSFVQGWHAFAKDNCLDNGDMLVFKVIHSLVLAVSIFDSEGNEKMTNYRRRNSSCNVASCEVGGNSAEQQPAQRQFRRLCKASERSQAVKVKSQEEPAIDELEKQCPIESKDFRGGPSGGDETGDWEEYLAPMAQEAVHSQHVKQEFNDLDEGLAPVAQEALHSQHVKQEFIDLDEDLAPMAQEAVHSQHVEQEFIDLDEDLAPMAQEAVHSQHVKQEFIDLDEDLAPMAQEAVHSQHVKQEFIDIDELPDQAIPPSTPVKKEAGPKRVFDLESASNRRVAEEKKQTARPAVLDLEEITKEKKRKEMSGERITEDAGERSKKMRKLDSTKVSGSSIRKQASKDPWLRTETARQMARNMRDLPKGMFYSNRREVTEDEINQAMDRAKAKAKALRCTHPTATVSLTKSQVFRGFWLGLPYEFCRRHLGHLNQRGWLVDGQGRRHSVKYIIEGRQSASGGGLSAGWRGFALQRTLDLHDVCVFELLDRTKFEMKVHIFRVVDLDDSDLICKHSISPVRRCW